MEHLLPYPALSSSTAKKFRASAGASLIQAGHHAKVLEVYFKIETHLNPKMMNEIILPSGKPSRKSELWKETCFECFIPDENSEAYLEFNGSIDGSWNWYSFESYREKMKEIELDGESLPRQKSFNRKGSTIESHWWLPWSGIEAGFLSAGQKSFSVKSLGLTLVMKTSNETLYWATKHDGDQPNFHLRSSFNFLLEGTKR